MGRGKEEEQVELQSTCLCSLLRRPPSAGTSWIHTDDDRSMQDDSFLAPSSVAGGYELAVAWLSSLPLPPSSKGTTPTTTAGWEMVEQWRILINSITSQGNIERERIARETEAWETRGMLDQAGYGRELI